MVSKRISNHVSQEDRKKIYKHLMRDGVLVVKKDATLLTHADTQIRNLHVMLTMRSMESKKYVTSTYNWGYLYYVVTAEGIEFLRSALGIPVTVLPSTYIAPTRVMATEVAV